MASWENNTKKGHWMGSLKVGIMYVAMVESISWFDARNNDFFLCFYAAAFESWNPWKISKCIVERNIIIISVFSRLIRLETFHVSVLFSTLNARCFALCRVACFMSMTSGLRLENIFMISRTPARRCSFNFFSYDDENISSSFNTTTLSSKNIGRTS